MQIADLRTRVRGLLLQDYERTLKTQFPSKYDHIETERFESDYSIPGKIHIFSASQRHDKKMGFLGALNAQASQPDGHLKRLNKVYCSLMTCYSRPEKYGGVDAVVERTVNRLLQLPPTPIILESCWKALNTADVDVAYFYPGQSKTWESLQVVQCVDENAIRLALRFQTMFELPKWASQDIKPANRLIDETAELIHLTRAPASVPHLIVQAFLWASWQRMVMLYFSYWMDAQLRFGCHNKNSDRFSLKNADIMGQRNLLNTGKAQYMCRYAFEKLRADRASIAQDFRAFDLRYTQIWKQTAPRCISKGNKSLQCTGQGVGACMRFAGATITNQSAHTADCSRGQSCWRMFWDESSYRQQDGCRAVSVIDMDETTSLLKYCTGSPRTMAISHVWSHGQGGRPEPDVASMQDPPAGDRGFNVCLHRRYSKIARSQHCESYWMDTPCIPEDHELRDEAIGYINWIFANSKLVVVCDRDLMQIESRDLTIELKESILATLLVCDWNVRSWTFLESLRGRSNLHIMLKYDRLLKVERLLYDVHSQGNIAISNLFVTSQHLLPTVGYCPSHSEIHRDNKVLRQKLMEIGDAADALGWRHASRPNDEIVIWSLLCNEDPSYTALEFWERQRCASDMTYTEKINFRTGFLVSSVPRLSTTGLSWAPSKPNLVPFSRTSNGIKQFFADNGTDSRSAGLEKRGLRSAWDVCVFKFHRKSIFDRINPFLTAQGRLFVSLSQSYIRGYKNGALLRPYSHGKKADTYPAIRSQEDDGPVFAVVATNGFTTVERIEECDWVWKGVFQWKDSFKVPVPNFQQKQLWLV